jgi:hypothetical protein
MNNIDADQVFLEEKKDPSKAISKDKPLIMKEVSMRRIMSYYSPKGIAAASVITSFMNAWSYPCYGLIFSKILFTLLMPTAPTYTHDINFWCGMFLL